MNSSQSPLLKHVALHCEITNDMSFGALETGVATSGAQRILQFWMENEELELCVPYALQSSNNHEGVSI